MDYILEQTPILIVPEGSRFKNIGGETGGRVVQDTAVMSDPITLEVQMKIV